MNLTLASSQIPYARAQWQLDSDDQIAEYEEEAFQIGGTRTGACAVC